MAGFTGHGAITEECKSMIVPSLQVFFRVLLVGLITVPGAIKANQITPPPGALDTLLASIALSLLAIHENSNKKIDLTEALVLQQKAVPSEAFHPQISTVMPVHREAEANDDDEITTETELLLPEELWLYITHYLDDISLYCFSMACLHFQSITSGERSRRIRHLRSYAPRNARAIEVWANRLVSFYGEEAIIDYTSQFIENNRRQLAVLTRQEDRTMSDTNALFQAISIRQSIIDAFRCDPMNISPDDRVRQFVILMFCHSQQVIGVNEISNPPQRVLSTFTRLRLPVLSSSFCYRGMPWLSALLFSTGFIDDQSTYNPDTAIHSDIPRGLSPLHLAFLTPIENQHFIICHGIAENTRHLFFLQYTPDQPWRFQDQSHIIPPNYQIQSMNGFDHQRLAIHMQLLEWPIKHPKEEYKTRLLRINPSSLQLELDRELPSAHSMLIEHPGSNSLVLVHRDRFTSHEEVEGNWQTSEATLDPSSDYEPLAQLADGTLALWGDSLIEIYTPRNGERVRSGRCEGEIFNICLASMALPSRQFLIVCSFSGIALISPSSQDQWAHTMTLSPNITPYNVFALNDSHIVILGQNNQRLFFQLSNQTQDAQEPPPPSRYLQPMT